jgi:hypothetical protein
MGLYQMKNKLIIALLVILLSSCNNLEGTRGFSNGIEESKKNGTFVFEYLPDKNEYSFGDSISFQVTEAFVERGWGHGNNQNPIKDTWNGNPSKDYQLVMVVKGVCCNQYGVDWSIEQKEGGGFSAKSENKMATTFKKENIKDTLIYDVIKGVALRGDDFDRNILGRIVLIKKPSSK